MMMMLMFMMMLMIGSLLFFLVLLVHVHVHKPFGHIGMIGYIDDDMNNEHVHFFVFPSFFLVLSVGRYIVPGYLLRGIPPRWVGHICI